jgi:hypothetical protein
MYKIIHIKTENIQNLKIFLFVFAIISPLLSFSCQMMRDIHICFLYTIMAYFTIKPQQHLRWVILSVLLITAYCIRAENGLFSLTIISIAIYRVYSAGGITKKGFIIGIIVLFAVFVLSILYQTLLDTTIRYHERGMTLASSGSLGSQLSNWPFPFNFFSKAFFSQILPFPFWIMFQNGEDYTFLRILELIFPFFWLPILLSLFYGFWKYRKLWDVDLSILFFIGIIYIVLVSYAEPTIRRIMAVYPLLFIAFVINNLMFELKISRWIIVSCTLIVVLHLIYIIIK